MASIKIAGLPVNARYHKLNTWQVKLTSPNSGRFIFWRDSLGGWEAVNVWAVREKFLAIQSPEEALNFFRVHGPLRLNEGAVAQQPFTFTMEEPYENLVRYQRWSEAFIKQPAPAIGSSFPSVALESDELAQRMAMGWESPPLPFTVETGFVSVRKSAGAKEVKTLSPYLELKAYDVVTAVRASIYIDKIRGYHGNLCEREDCHRTFFSMDPRKRFCSEPIDCGAVVRSRNKRSRERVGGVNGKA